MEGKRVLWPVVHRAGDLIHAVPRNTRENHRVGEVLPQEPACFLLVPRCLGLCGLKNNIGMSVVTVKT